MKHATPLKSVRVIHMKALDIFLIPSRKNSIFYSNTFDLN